MRARGNGGHLELSTKFLKRFPNIWRRSLLVPSLIESPYLCIYATLSAMFMVVKEPWWETFAKFRSQLYGDCGQRSDNVLRQWHLTPRPGWEQVMSWPHAQVPSNDVIHWGHRRPLEATRSHATIHGVLAWWVEQLSWFPAVFILCCCMKYFSNVVTLARRPCSRSPDMHPPHCLVTCNFWLNNIMDCC